VSELVPESGTDSAGWLGVIIALAGLRFAMRAAAVLPRTFQTLPPGGLPPSSPGAVGNLTPLARKRAPRPPSCATACRWPGGDGVAENLYTLAGDDRRRDDWPSSPSTPDAVRHAA
jgi:hypothetical protein